MRAVLGRIRRTIFPPGVFEPRRLPWPKPQAETGVGLVTMVKNEDTLLTHWLTHYMRLLPSPRFLVIDDASDRVDTADVVRRAGAEAVCDIVHLPPGPFSDLYKSTALSSLANILLERCATVITTDVDEIVTPVGAARGQDFETLLQQVPRPFASPIGVMPVHLTEMEAPFDPWRPVAGQRGWGFLHGGSTKPVIWRGQTAVFTAGQHTLWERRVPVISTLATLHLRWVDHETALARQADRNAIDYALAQKDNQGGHWKVAPTKMSRNKFMDPARHIAGARPLSQAAPDFMRRHMVREGDAYILKERQILEPVLLDGEI